MGDVQQLIDTLYHRAYERIWTEFAKGVISAETAADRTAQAWDRAAAAIVEKTGYTLDGNRS